MVNAWVISCNLSISTPTLIMWPYYILQGMPHICVASCANREQWWLAVYSLIGLLAICFRSFYSHWIVYIYSLHVYYVQPVILLKNLDCVCGFFFEESDFALGNLRRAFYSSICIYKNEGPSRRELIRLFEWCCDVVRFIHVACTQPSTDWPMYNGIFCIQTTSLISKEDTLGCELCI